MKIPLNKICHHPDNQDIYQLSDIDDLIKSIEEVGLLQPPIINQHNQIISGNRRFLAITRLGWKSVDVEQVDIPIKETKKYIIHYNKFRKKTSQEILNEYHILKEYYKRKSGRKKNGVPQNTIKGKSRDIIAEELNLASSQLAKLLIIEKENEKLVELIDKDIMTVAQAYMQVSRIKKEKASRSKSSTSVQSNNTENYTFHQKCSSSLDEIDDESIQMIFTSPPYWNKRKYDDEDNWLGNEANSDDYVENLVNHLTDSYRVLSKKGSFFLVLGDTFLDGNLRNIPHKVVIALQDKGWILRNTIIWKKTNPKPTRSKSNLTPSYEFIFHLVKSMDYHYQHTYTPLNPSTKASLPPRHRTPGKDSEYTTSITPYVPAKGKNMGDYFDEAIIEVATANQPKVNGEHPAPFPEKVVVLPLLQTTIEDDTVLDIFHGSGTTGKVALHYGRKYIGYDLKTYHMR